MYIGRIEKTKKTLEKIINNKEPTFAEEILQAIGDALDTITILEDECKMMYSEGKVDGMEWMATILCGTERTER